jgi:Protein of unknown function (DUF2934)
LLEWYLLNSSDYAYGAPAMHPEHRSIGELAYLLWQARGCPPGTEEKDWLDAEKQLRLEAEKARPESRPESQPSRLPVAASRLPEDAARASEQPAPKSSAKRPNRARALKPKSGSSKPLSLDSSKPGDPAG